LSCHKKRPCLESVANRSSVKIRIKSRALIQHPFTSIMRSISRGVPPGSLAMSMTAPTLKTETQTWLRPNASRSGHGRSLRGPKEIISFVTVVTVVFLSATWFVCATWNRFWGAPAKPEWWIVPPALSVAFIVATILGMRRSNGWLRLLYRVSAVWIGLLNFCVFAALACWIVLTASALGGWRVEPRWIAALFFGLAALAGGYGLVNAAWLRVTRVTVKLPNLPAAWHGRDAVLVSDLHLGNVRGAGFARRVVKKIRRLRPCAVFVCGDMFDGPKADFDRLAEPWRELSAPAGIYFVTGNHEEFTDRAKFLAAVGRAGLRVLNNEKVTVEGLQIVGVHDGEAEDPRQLGRILREAELDRGRASILLAHRPANLALAEAAGVSLQLSGHTHRGQNWPWSWIIYKVHGPFAYGLNRLGNLLVLTSSGAGTWGPPMRAGTKSEIVLFRLERGA